MSFGHLYPEMLSPSVTEMKRISVYWYCPGMISLVLLPLMCVVFLYRRGVFKEYRIIPVWRITREFYEPPQNNSIIFVRPPDRQNTNIILDDHEADAELKLDYAQRILQNIVNEQDTTRGVYFKFTDRSKYRVFVRVLEICKMERLNSFVTLENDVRAYYQKPASSHSDIIPFLLNCIVCEGNDVHEQLKNQAQRMQFRNYLSGCWPVGLGFGLLACLSFLTRRFRKGEQMINRPVKK